MKNILIASATKLEIAPFLQSITALELAQLPNPFLVEKNKVNLTVLITGVGGIQTTYHLTRYLSTYGLPDLIIFPGIAGSFTPNIGIGDVVLIQEDQFGDIGAQDPNGTFVDLWDMNLIHSDEPPFKNRKIVCPNIESFQIAKLASGLSVNKVTSSPEDVANIRKHFNAEIETMENASMYYVASQFDCLFLGIRSISNFVGIRNKSEWNIPLAVSNLNESLISMVDVLTADE